MTNLSKSDQPVGSSILSFWDKSRLYVIIACFLVAVSCLYNWSGPMIIIPVAIVFACLSLYYGDYKYFAAICAVAIIARLMVSKTFFIYLHLGHRLGDGAQIWQLSAFFSLMGCGLMALLVLRNLNR